MQESYILPCEPIWEPGIYQFEVDDVILGYNPETGEDGVHNLQALHLGNRTLYLKEFIETDHTEAGHHNLINEDFVDGTIITEDKLNLDYSTQDLDNTLTQIEEQVEDKKEHASEYANMNLSFAGALSYLVPYSRELVSDHISVIQYELFTDRVSLRNTYFSKILDAISGDDSLDVESTENLKVGESYIIMDAYGNNREIITIKSILSFFKYKSSKLRLYSLPISILISPINS